MEEALPAERGLESSGQGGWGCHKDQKAPLSSCKREAGCNRQDSATQQETVLPEPGLSNICWAFRQVQNLSLTEPRNDGSINMKQSIFCKVLARFSGTQPGSLYTEENLSVAKYLGEKKPPHYLEQWFFKCGPQTSSISLSCKLIRNANFQAHPRAAESEPLA